jgi:hypothetical protein
LFLIALAPNQAPQNLSHPKVRFPRAQAAGAEALAAPVLSDAPMLVHGPMASGVAAEALLRLFEAAPCLRQDVVAVREYSKRFSY